NADRDRRLHPRATGTMETGTGAGSGADAGEVKEAASSRARLVVKGWENQSTPLVLSLQHQDRGSRGCYSTSTRDAALFAEMHETPRCLMGGGIAVGPPRARGPALAQIQACC